MNKYAVLNGMFLILMNHTIASEVLLIKKNSFQAITTLVYGRLGDQLMGLMKAKYFSLKYNMPILIRPFEHCDKFSCCTECDQLTCRIEELFTTKKLIRDESDIVLSTEENTLFIVDLSSSLNSEGIVWEPDFFVEEIIQAAREYPLFGIEIKNMLNSVHEKSNYILPKDMITVAVHIRKGSGGDCLQKSIQLFDQETISSEETILDKECRSSYLDTGFPLKSPPEQFYIDQIKKLAAIFEHNKIFIAIFTDDKKPQELIDRIKQSINNPLLVFAQYSTGSPDDPVSDLVDMAQFDCLIRSCSFFSCIAQLMGNHTIVISPKKYVWRGDYLTITEVNMLINAEKSCPFNVTLNLAIDNDLKTYLNSIMRKKMLNAIDS